jgi:hypothetical protein
VNNEDSVTVKTFEVHWVIWFAALWTSSYEILVDIKYNDSANSLHFSDAIIYIQ